MKGVFLDRASLMPPDAAQGADVDLSALTALFPDWTFYDQTAPEQTVDRIQGATVIITNKVVLDKACLQRVGGPGKALRLICVAATGTNNVDEEAAEHYGICVRNVSGYATPSVTEHVFALMLALVRRLPDYQRAVLAGRWQLSKQFCLLDFPISELAGRRLGIIGYGELGRAVAVVARAFGMSVIIAARPGTAPVAGRVALEQLLHEADVVSLHCPLTDASRDLIGVKELALMKAGALLINTARGGIVDEQALANALRSGQIGGAAVDVLLTEPPCAGNPLLADDIPNLIITPHIAWASREARQRLVDGVVANIQEWIDKKGLRTED